jgi:hypothetical protein
VQGTKEGGEYAHMLGNHQEDQAHNDGGRERNVRHARVPQNVEKDQMTCNEPDHYNRKRPRSGTQVMNLIHRSHSQSGNPNGHVADGASARTNCKPPNPTGPLFTHFNPASASIAITLGKLTRPWR